MSASSSSESVHQCFLQEAAELLQTMDAEIQDIQPNFSVQKVHNLMRSAHTLKGAAASVGLDNIKAATHSLEDVFKALCYQDTIITVEMEALIFRAFECLQLLLSAQVGNRQTDESILLDRIASVISQLQEMLGDRFGQDGYLPSSSDLGFDMTQSIFEVGVTQKIEELTTAINCYQSGSDASSADSDALLTLLTAQSDVFIGLAESLNLPGFKEIAVKIQSALNTHPERTFEIAQVALENLLTARACVFAGDRTQGGEPSQTLLSFCTSTHSTVVSNKTDQRDISQHGDEQGFYAQNLECSMLPGPSDLEGDLVALNLSDSDLVDFSDSIALSDEALPDERLSTGKEASSNQCSYSQEQDNEVADKESVEIEGFLIDSEMLPKTSLKMSDCLNYTLNYTVDYPVGYSVEIDKPSIAEAVEPNISDESLDFFLDTEPFCDVFDDSTRDCLIEPPLSEAGLSEASSTLESSSYASYGADFHSVEVQGSNLDSFDSTELQPDTSQEHSSQSFWIEEDITDSVQVTQLSSTSQVSTSQASTSTSQASTSKVQTLERESSLVSASETYPLESTAATSQTKTAQHNNTSSTHHFNQLQPLSCDQSLTKQPQPKQRTVRIAVHHLDQLGHDMGELLTQQNRQQLHTQQLSKLVQQVSNDVRQQKALLELEDERLQYKAACFDVDQQECAPPRLKRLDSLAFDSLELDDYSHTQLRSHQLLASLTRQLKAIEKIEQRLQHLEQTSDKQTRLLSTTRETLLTARMQPIGQVFQRFSATLRRLQTQHNKQVNLVLEGESVLVDKAIADKLFDPLLHLVRNAFDHGLEFPEIRQQKGKSAVGTLSIKATHQGRYLIVQVEDDGQGLNLESILQKAIASQLVTAVAAADLTSDQIVELLFAPGFSTASEVDDLSGRGVGLDAVQAQVGALGGDVRVDYSLNQGTCFTIRLPADLTIAKLLLCQSGSHTYALMTDAVKRIVLPSASQIKSWQGGKALVWPSDNQEHLVAITALHDLLRYNSSASRKIVADQIKNAPLTSSTLEVSPVVVIQHDDTLLAIEVHQIIGEQELVIHSLDDTIPAPDYLYGSSLLPNGQLTLVLDSMALAHHLLDKYTQNSSNTQFEKQTIALPQYKTIPATNTQLILTVDDSATVRQTITDVLQRSGYQVIQASNGEEALQQLQSYTGVGLILCDIEMPGMNGFEFLKARQQNASIFSIPTIMLSSRGGPKHRLLTESLGATDHLTKPYVAADLIKRVDELISQQSPV